MDAIANDFVTLRDSPLTWNAWFHRLVLDARISSETFRHCLGLTRIDNFGDGPGQVRFGHMGRFDLYQLLIISGCACAEATVAIGLTGAELEQVSAVRPLAA